MRLDTADCRRLAGGSRSAVLATTGPHHRPHVVPIVFAVDADTIVTAVDTKPKTTRRLQRLANLERDPRCAVLFDHYQEDWERIWWVRADGQARIDGDPAGLAAAVAALAPRYPMYTAHPPPGPVLWIDVERWTGWAASPPRPPGR